MAAPNQYTAPNATEYGGGRLPFKTPRKGLICANKSRTDEVSAIVLDPGFSTTRAGFAGEDVPKSVVPTHYGIYSTENTERELLFGDNSVHTPLPDLEIQNPLAGEGVEEWVSDWDAATKLWEYTITSRLISPHPTKPFKNGLNDIKSGDGDMEMDGIDEAERPLAENPLLMTEPGISSQKSREKITEIAMENWGAPAFWLGRSGVLAA
jgi:actin-related protein 4